MLTGLLLTAFLMGLGGIPHCTAMCGAACAAALPRGLPAAAWFGRLLGYALLGAVAAVSAGAVSRWGREVAMLKPLWVMVQVAAVMLGLYLLMVGRMPAVLDGAGRSAYDSLRARMAGLPQQMSEPWQSMWRLSWPFVGGMAWALLPCGLLYAALMVAALAPDAQAGAGVMASFALPSSVGVWAAPWILRRLGAWRQRSGAAAAVPPVGVSEVQPASVPVIWLQQARGVAPSGSDVRPEAAAASGVRANGPWADPRWALRVAGLSLALMSAWAVWHQLVAQWQAWCA